MMRVRASRSLSSMRPPFFIFFSLPSSSSSSSKRHIVNHLAQLTLTSLLHAGIAAALDDADGVAGEAGRTIGRDVARLAAHPVLAGVVREAHGIAVALRIAAQE